jgi:hypothetical protein
LSHISHNLLFGVLLVGGPNLCQSLAEALVNYPVQVSTQGAPKLKLLLGGQATHPRKYLLHREFNGYTGGHFSHLLPYYSTFLYC